MKKTIVALTAVTALSTFGTASDFDVGNNAENYLKGHLVAHADEVDENVPEATITGQPNEIRSDDDMYDIYISMGGEQLTQRLAQEARAEQEQALQDGREAEQESEQESEQDDASDDENGNEDESGNENATGESGDQETEQPAFDDGFESDDSVIEWEQSQNNTGEAHNEYYSIQWGDTLSHIAQYYGVNYMDLVIVNQIEDPDLIFAETDLKVQWTTEEYNQAYDEYYGRLEEQSVAEQPVAEQNTSTDTSYETYSYGHTDGVAASIDHDQNVADGLDTYEKDGFLFEYEYHHDGSYTYTYEYIGNPAELDAENMNYIDDEEDTSVLNEDLSDDEDTSVLNEDLSV